MNIVWLPLGDTPAQRAAWEWISSVHGVNAIRCDSARPLDAALELGPDAVWIDAAEPVADAAPFAAIPGAKPGFLLTGGAVMLPSLLGLETASPGSVIDRVWSDADDELFLFRDFAETPRIRGHAAFRRHRLFDGLGSGAYTWWPHDGDGYRAITWRLPDWPGIAGVIAVERAFIHLEHDRATIWEYVSPRIVCIGAFLPFESPDPLFRPHRERLALNALRHAAGTLPAAEPDLFWRPPRPRRSFDPALRLTRAPDASATGDAGRPLPFETATLAVPGGRGPDPVTLAGRRAFAAGDEANGIAEVWCHPVRVMADLRLPRGVDLPLQADTGRQTSAREGHEVTSLGLIRKFRFDNATVIERTFVPRDLPGLVIEWENESASHVELEAVWETDLRLMWPYAAGVLGPIHWNADASTLRVAVPRSGENVTFAVTVSRRDSGRDTGVTAPIRAPTQPHVEFSVGRANPGSGDPAPAPAPGAAPDESAPGQGGYPQAQPDSGVTPDTSAYRLPCAVRVRVPPGGWARLLVAAETSPGDDARSFIASLANAGSLVRARAASLRRLQREHVSIASPDEQLDRAIEWAKVRLDSYLVDTPGVGRSLVAGYWKSRPGWNDGRPGYAWYFGRDAVWTACACLAVGLFDASREVIAFLAAHQDLNGKILHECTTSGSVHYDAADATPLWLLLVARHLAWTGDLSFTRSVWPNVRRALDFCFATDSDGDGLIENTRVGHGWIEFGRLGGGRATFYNAGIWTAALRELAVAAESIGDAGPAAALQDRYRRARSSLEARFFDPRRRVWAHRIEPDDHTPTATHAVPLLLGSVDPTSMDGWLDLVETDEFTADWGVRLIPGSDPDFRPESYHGGAIWPLYTGWTSIAEYAAGRFESAFRHWTQITRLAFEDEKGAWPEVLHGTERRAIGVCPDQAWSTAMAVWPLVEGMLGARPDAPRNRLTLRPTLPAGWARFELHNLRMGDALVDLEFRRDGSRYIFHIAQEAGSVPVRLVFEPAIAGRAVVARIDDQPSSLMARPLGNRLIVPMQLMLDHERTIELEVVE